MILSSADILRILGGNQIIRLAAKVQLVESKPALSGREGLFIYIKRYPELAEFEATFTLWVESDGSEPDDIVIAELKKLLPKVRVTPGLMTEVKTTEFRSESTLEAPTVAPVPQVDMSALEERFEALAEDIQDQMLLVTSGRNGRDGRDGADGRDGRDLVATEADLEDLQNVEQQGPKEKGQVLTWDGTSWVNLYIPQVYSTISAGGGGSGGDIALDDLTDVDAPTPKWENAAAPPADISGNSIDDLSDVDTSTAAPTVGQVLEWNGTNWVPADAAATGVTQIIAGNNITIDPVGGTGAVTVNAADSVNDADGGDFGELPNPDGANFDNGTTTSTLAYPVDGGDFNTGTSEAFGDSLFDGGEAT